MKIAEQLGQQRVKHIVSSYQLDGNEARFDDDLANLLCHYPAPLVELALAETLIDNWLSIPMVRGQAFLAQVYQRLKSWEEQTISTTLTPQTFQQITGLNPGPIFGTDELTPTQPIQSSSSSSTGEVGQ